MVDHDGTYYLFYSGNGYWGSGYAVGVARSGSPLGPFVKADAPIVATAGEWIGPGHNAVVDTPAHNTYLVYHAWRQGHVNGPGDARVALVDRVFWNNGWPSVPAGPSSRSLPVP